MDESIKLNAEGYATITIEDKVVYGENAWINVTKDNADDYDF